MNTLVLWVWAFGVAILHYLSRLHPDKTFYAYEKDDVSRAYLMSERKSKYFFPEITFGKNVEFLEDPKTILPQIDHVLLIIPNQFIASTLDAYKDYFKENVIFLNLSKGINNATLETVSDTLHKLSLPGWYIYGCLSGGMIASELVAWNPLGADIGISDMNVGVSLRSFFEGPNLAVNIIPQYKNTELFWALKNVFALYVGYLEWKGYGASTVGYHYCLLWRDMEHLLPMLWGETTMNFWDYALGGDMIATCFGNSRNKYFGKLVGGGMTPTEAYEQLKLEKKHAEGFETLKWLKSFTDGKVRFDELQKVIEIFIDK